MGGMTRDLLKKKIVRVGGFLKKRENSVLQINYKRNRSE